MYQYRLVKTRWGIVAYVARGNKLVKLFLPPDLPGGKFSSADEKRRRAFQLRQIHSALADDKIGVAENANLLPGLAAELKNYFAGSRLRFTCRVDLSGLTPFTRSVLALAAKIPPGKTCAYRDLAEKIGKPRAVRAVARALASNPIPLVIPCHRVRCADGSLGGFSAPCGVAMKKMLLEHEARKKFN